MISLVHPLFNPKLILVIFLSVLLQGHLHAEEKVLVGINHSLNQNLPHVVAELKQTLLSTGINISFVVLPAERELISAANGDIAMTSYRQPLAVAQHESLVQIKPAINELSFFLFTVPDQKNVCKLSEEEYKEIDAVGLLGVKLYPTLVYPKFRSGTNVLNFSQVLTMLDKNRAHVSIAPLDVIEQGRQKTGINLHVCEDKPFIKIPFYSYLHKDYLHLKPKIESAYQKVFGQSR